MLDYHLKDVTNESYEELMRVERILLSDTPVGLTVFQSKSIPFQPVKDVSAVFGGHVLGQSVIAGGATVPDDFVCHSSSSYFLRPGIAEIPFVYAVEPIRDGASYVTREVRCYQVEEHHINEFRFQHRYLRFVCLLSFKKVQENCLDYQVDANPAFDAPSHDIIQMELAPDVDTPSVADLLHEGGVEAQWHPLDCRKMDTKEYNKTQKLIDRRIVHYFRSTFELSNSPHIHVSLLLYISDRNSLFTLLNIQENPRTAVIHIASLNHVFTLHQLEPRVDEDYLQMVTWSDRAYDSRGFYNGRMYDSNGCLIASFTQDGVVKIDSSKL